MLLATGPVSWWILIVVCVPAGLLMGYLVFDLIRGILVRRRHRSHG